MTMPKRKYDELSLHEKFQFNHLVQMMIDGWVEDIDKKMFVINRFNLDYRDDVPMQFLMGMYQPEKITLPPPKEISPKEAFEKFRQEHLSSQWSKPFKFDPPIEISEIFGEYAQKEITTNISQEVIPDGNGMAYSDEWIVMQNRLLHAISHLTLDERRLILLLSPIVRREIAKNPKQDIFDIHVKDFVSEYGINSKKYYGELEKIADSILKKAFYYWNFKDNKPFGEKTHKSGVSWFSWCDYLENEAILKIQLNNRVIEMLTIFDKANPFTKYQKEWITKLGTYGIILLELILSCMYQKHKQKSYTVEYLREKFDCVENYAQFSDFKTKVINKAIKEIHENTPIRISYTQKKRGRAVSELIFTFENTEIKQLKVEQQPKLNNKIQDPYTNFKMTPKQLAFFGSKLAKKLDKDIELVIDEISNVHLQGQYVECLKTLDFIPSEWYTDDEMKDHPTAEQIKQAKADEKARAKAEKEQKQQQLKQDFKKLVSYADIFVQANLDKVSTIGIEQLYLKNKDYTGIVKVWEHHLLDERERKRFALVDEILAR